MKSFITVVAFLFLAASATPTFAAKSGEKKATKSAVHKHKEKSEGCCDMKSAEKKEDCCKMDSKKESEKKEKEETKKEAEKK